MASAYGAKSGKLAPCARPLVFSDMTLRRNGDRWTLTEAQGVEFFQGLSGDVALLALGTYFAQLLETVSDEDRPGDMILPLGLNALYAVSSGERPPELIKAAFELRLMCLAGFEPSLGACSACGRGDMTRALLDVGGGAIYCDTCGSGARGEGRGGYAELDAPSLLAARYITSCAPKRLFSFTLAPASRRKLSEAAERYALAHLDRSFRALDYYRQVR